MNETYLEKLRNPKWQKIRLKVLERDNWTCLWCFNNESTLHVHHKIYKKGKEPWEYELDNFLTLCEECHFEESENRKKAESLLIDALKESGFSALQLDGLACDIMGSPENPLTQFDPHIVAIGETFKQPKFREVFLNLYFKYLKTKKNLNDLS